MATPLIKKLRLSQESKTLILNSPEGYIEGLESMKVDIQVQGKYDFVQLFIKDSGDWKKFGETAIEALNYDGIFWVCYPKKSSKLDSDLSRDMMWDLVGKPNGLRPVSQIAIDETWSGLRFRPNEKVGK